MEIRRHYKKILLLLLPFFCLFFVDQNLILRVAQDNHAAWRDFGAKFTDLAAGRYWWMAVFSLLALSYASLLLLQGFRAKKLAIRFRNWSSHFLLALFSTGAVAQILKVCVGRERPCFAKTALRVWDFGAFRHGYLYSSFPSGHSQVIFCAATFLAILHPRLRIPFFLLAFSVAFTRVLVLKHFPSDVAAGMLLGVYGSRVSIKFWSNWVPEPSRIRF